MQGHSLNTMSHPPRPLHAAGVRFVVRDTRQASIKVKSIQADRLAAPHTRTPNHYSDAGCNAGYPRDSSTCSPVYGYGNATIFEKPGTLAVSKIGTVYKLVVWTIINMAKGSAMLSQGVGCDSPSG